MAVAQGLAGLQRIDLGVGVVQRVGVAAVGVEHQRAVLEDEGAGRHRRGIGVGADRVVAQHAAGDHVGRGVLADARRVVGGGRQAVDDVDGQRAAGRAAGAGDGQRDVIGAVRQPRLVLRRVQGVGVGQRAGRRVVAGERQRADAGVDRLRRRGQGAELRGREGGAADAEAGQPAGRMQGDRAGGAGAGVVRVEQSAFEHRGLADVQAVAVRQVERRRAGRGRPGVAPAAVERLVHSAAAGGIELEAQRIEVLDDALQADESRSAAGVLLGRGARRGVVGTVVEAARLVERRDGAPELAAGGQGRRLGGAGHGRGGGAGIDGQRLVGAQGERLSVHRREVDGSAAAGDDDLARVDEVAGMQGAQGAVFAFGIGPALNGGDAGDGNGGGHDVGCFRSGDDSRHLKPARSPCLLYQGTMERDRAAAAETGQSHERICDCSW